MSTAMNIASTINNVVSSVADLMGMGHSARVMASVYPEVLKAERRYKTHAAGGFYNEYRLGPGASDGSFVATLAIGAALESHNIGSQNGKIQLMQTPVPGGADAIASDLFHQWSSLGRLTMGDGSDVGVGVWICQGTEPTKEEITRAVNRQRRWFEALVANADEIFHKTNSKAELSSMHYMAARELKVDPSKHPWMRAVFQGERRSCQFCRTDIDALAVICPNCNRVIDPAGLKALESALSEATTVTDRVVTPTMEQLSATPATHPKPPLPPPMNPVRK